MRHDIYNGEILSGAIIRYPDKMHISSGGVANSTTVNWAGYMHISSGGIANNTTVNSGGGMHISNGGTANSTTVDNGGDMCIYSGGAANSTTMNGGFMYISSGGVANSTSVNDGYMYIYSGAANSTTVNDCGWMLIYSGGTANRTTVNSSGWMFISSGGVANSTTVNPRGSMFIYSGGVANSTTVNYDGYMYIYSGGVANSTSVNSGGTMYISNGGTANSTTVNSGGGMYISVGGVANSTTVNYDGYMRISSGGTANSTTVNYDGYMRISSGGTANSTNVNSCGRMSIHSDGIANSTTINSGGSLYIDAGGIANSTTVNYKGSMYISSGGTATYIVENGGYVEVENGVKGTNVVFASHTMSDIALRTSMTVHKNTVADHTTVNERGALYIHSGGVANSTTVNYKGSMYISSGGTATYIIENGGYVEVAAGADVTFASNTISGLTFGDYVFMTVHKNTIADKTTFSRGKILISNGGMANRTAINTWGSMHIFSGGMANDTFVNPSGYLYVSSGGMANNTIINCGGRLIIDSYGTASHTIVGSGGCMDIYVCGSATDIVENGGHVSVDIGTEVTFASNTISDMVLRDNSIMTVHKNTVANRTTVNSGAEMRIYSGGMANSTSVNSGCILYIESGGTATNIYLSSGGILGGFSFDEDKYFETTKYGSVTISPNVHIIGNAMYISSGGTANNTTTHGGVMFISKGGMANNTAVLGDMHISGGGVANSTTVSSWHYMFISSGGTHCGSLNIEYGAVVSAYDGSTVDFTVAGRKTSDGYLINDLSRISGNPEFTITVATDQENGIYQLAQGAENFTGSISAGTEDVRFGKLTVNGEALKYNGTSYSLDLNNGNLTLTVDGRQSLCSNNLLSNNISQIVAWDQEKGAVGFTATDGIPGNKWRGIWDWDGKDAELWRVVGVGHFAGSKVDHDGILLYNGIGTTFAAWTNLNDPSYGYVDLCHVEGNFNTRCLADLDGDKYDDVLIYDEKGSFGVVLDGAAYQDIWHVDNAASNPWQLKDAGDFGGEQEKLIVQNKSGHLYLWTNLDPTFKTWNWSQEAIGFLGNDWEYAGAGDFRGDGTDDIVVRKLSDGGLWIWDDGNSSTAHWVVTPGKGFKVEAIGDYNGDGKEDILVREYNTGWGGMGYYAPGSDTLWNDLNARIETDLESSFAIIA